MLLNTIGRPILVLGDDLQLRQSLLGNVTAGVGLNHDRSIAHLTEALSAQPRSDLEEARRGCYGRGRLKRGRQRQKQETLDMSTLRYVSLGNRATTTTTTTWGHQPGPPMC